MEWFNELAEQLDPAAIKEMSKKTNDIQDSDARNRERLKVRLVWKPSEQALQKRREYLRSVGVWTDDYSNLLSVFSK